MVDNISLKRSTVHVSTWIRLRCLCLKGGGLRVEIEEFEKYHHWPDL